MSNQRKLLDNQNQLEIETNSLFEIIIDHCLVPPVAYRLLSCRKRYNESYKSF